MLKNDGVMLAKVDATVESGLGSRFGVSGYPTLKVFRHGVASEYKGPRDAAGIAAYMRKQVGPSSKPLASKADVDAFVSDDGSVPAVVYFYTAKGSSFTAWQEVSNKHRETLRFGEVTDAAALAGFGISKNTVVVFKPAQYVHASFDTPQAELSGRYTTEELEKFVFENALPLVSQINPEPAALFEHGGRAQLLAIYDVDFKRDAKGSNHVANRLRKAAKAVRDDASIAAGNLGFFIASKSAYSTLVSDFGLSATVAKHGLDGVAVVILDKARNKKYRMDAPFSDANVVQFVRAFAAGELEAYIKSEPVPDVNPDAHGVTKVVARNFDSVVLDANKDVLFEMYAPWCGHCKSLAPIYDQLGERFKGSETVVIAKMDATANEHGNSAYSANGYPTILFAPAGKKDAPIKYTGDRTVAAMADFIKKNSGLKTKKTKDL